MKNFAQILVDRLKAGQTQTIQELFTSDFLDLHEEELKADAPIAVSGETYLSDNELILKISASTSVSMPCAICNQFISIPLAVKDFYHAEPLEAIPSAIFDYQPSLREALLLELPQYVECNHGKCPGRVSLTPYLRSEEKIQEKKHFPFSDL